MATRIHPGGGRKPRNRVAATMILTVRLTPEEMARLDSARGALPRTEWVRQRLALGLTPEAELAYDTSVGG